jgi:UDP-N-acetylmuramoyl-L-alanyl-D-glutamate--2,6-diaminopimelate ligase
MKKLIPQKLKNYYHFIQAVLANLIYGFPSGKIKIIGITGTNGKTTTVQMITKILEESGAKVAMASTINFKIGEKEWVNATKFTTLSSFSVQKLIRQAVDAKCEYLVLETSSHSLDQYRVWGVRYDAAVITNVTREHLDYHKTMEEYRLAKHRLFRNVKTIVVNLDMEKPQDYVVHSAKNKFGYTVKDTNNNYDERIEIIKAEDLELGINYSRYRIKNTEFDLKMPGNFNVENALAAACVGKNYGVKLETIKNALEKMTGVPGRMEHIPNDKNIDIIVDYAVTPDSLEKLYSLVSQIRSNSQALAQNSRVISVFGSCGERDRGKRPIMGGIVDKYADYIIITNEDPYNEDPWQIINEVAAGVKNKEENKNFWKIFDRREAILRALQLAHSGDIVVVSGKGAEEIMLVGDKRIPWNDKEVISEELKNIN